MIELHHTYLLAQVKTFNCLSVWVWVFFSPPTYARKLINPLNWFKKSVSACERDFYRRKELKDESWLPSFSRILTPPLNGLPYHRPLNECVCACHGCHLELCPENFPYRLVGYYKLLSFTCPYLLLSSLPQSTKAPKNFQKWFTVLFGCHLQGGWLSILRLFWKMCILNFLNGIFQCCEHHKWDSFHLCCMRVEAEIWGTDNSKLEAW